MVGNIKGKRRKCGPCLTLAWGPWRGAKGQLAPRTHLLWDLGSDADCPAQGKAIVGGCLYILGIVAMCCHGSVTQSCPTLCNPRQQHARLPHPSPSCRACSNSCPSSWGCHPTISSSVTPFSSCSQSLSASGSFPMCQLFASGGLRIGISARPGQGEEGAGASHHSLYKPHLTPPALHALTTLVMRGLGTEHPTVPVPLSSSPLPAHPGTAATHTPDPKAQLPQWT